MSKKRKTLDGAIPFSHLSIGKTFRFDSEWLFPFSGMKIGLATKISSLDYRYVDDGMVCRVGNKKTGVVPTDK